MRAIMQDEVDQVEEMSSYKSPGPDDFTTYFFNYYWSMVREEVFQLLDLSRTSKQVPSALNATFLTLIPKEDLVTNPKQFREITLCNIIYKIIKKVIAVRIKPILPCIISMD
jgi:hypothetical protein